MRSFGLSGFLNKWLSFGLSVAVVTATLAPLGVNASQFKRVRDANVSCGEQLSCDLYFSNPSVTLSSVGLRRSGAPDAPISLVLTTRDSLSSPSSISFSIDGQPVATFERADLSYRAAVYEYLLDDDTVVAKFISAARAGERLQVEYQTRNGKTAAQFSLEGMDAGIEFMDRVQGRTGQADALAEIGGTAPSTNSGQVEQTVSSVDDIPFSIRSDFYTGDSADCAGTNLDRGGFSSGFGVDLDGGKRLLVLPCGPNLPEGQSYAAFEEDGRKIRQISFPVLTEAGLTTTTVVSSLEWDNELRELISNTGRDAGSDCGVFRRWHLSEVTQAVALVLVEQRTETDCGSGTASAPEDWPLVWPLLPQNG